MGSNNESCQKCVKNSNQSNSTPFTLINNTHRAQIEEDEEME
jgi:hypothetical protein